MKIGKNARSQPNGQTGEPVHPLARWTTREKAWILLESAGEAKVAQTKGGEAEENKFVTEFEMASG